MPSRTNGSVATAQRFELPALDFNFSSLTEGTNIPPPLPSPILEEPVLPKTPVPRDAPSTANGQHAKATSPPSSGAKSGVKRSAEDAPASPTHSHRQGSIRRLFSRNMLNSAYASGETESQASIDVSHRPASRSNGSFMDDRKTKRSSGWFRRFRSGDSSPPSTSSNTTTNHRASVINQEPAKKPAGPPPPMIPELSALESKLDFDDGGSLGSDLFKNIK